MTECLVNDAPLAADSRPETWGELLDTLDRTLGPGRCVVTAVRFDGVDEPSFRAPARRGRDLASVARVEVDAVEATHLLDDALTAAADSLPALAAGARAAGAAYRSGAVEAHGQLAALVAAIQSLIALTTAAATAARAAGGASAPGGDITTACGAVEQTLAALVDRHTRADWPALAEALDCDLAGAILDWQSVLDAIRGEVA